ncbi:MAG: hypothetical protein CMJ83_16930 [Planctomycetes bacterium]|nr:hypothetical protein [Planctomycetota bacterium]
MDGLKCFTARGEDGEFSTDGGTGPEPDWTGLVLIFPYSAAGLPELRRYDVRVDDLLGTTPAAVSNWTAFDAAAPSMIDLFDFGTDGTTDGVPDGRVPVTAVTSDAQEESFFIGEWYGSPSVVISKRLNTPGTWPYRYLSLMVRLSDGTTWFSVTHQEASDVYWIAYGQFTRAPRVLARDVTEFAVSTAASCPFDAIQNPSGLQDPKATRITLVTTGESEEKGARKWFHNLDTITITSRN